MQLMIGNFSTRFNVESFYRNSPLNISQPFEYEEKKQKSLSVITWDQKPINEPRFN